ncbi:MAG: PAS domain S-box protein [Spirochaetia bacterium]|nr:PAS domain S-box protein [Spirochaetia bacterium]
MPPGAPSAFVRFMELSVPNLALGAVALCSALILVALREHPRSSLRASLFVNLAATAFVGLELVVIACGLIEGAIPTGRLFHAAQVASGAWFVPAFFLYARAVANSRLGARLDRALRAMTMAGVAFALLVCAATAADPSLVISQTVPSADAHQGATWAARGTRGPLLSAINLASSPASIVALATLVRVAFARAWRRDDWLHLAAVLVFILSSLQSLSQNLFGGFLDPFRELQVSRVGLGGATFAVLSSLAVLGTFAADARKAAEARASADRELAERRNVEKALESSKRQLADILDFLPDPTFAIDLEGRIIAWNRAIAELSGKSADEVMGRGDYEYALPFFGSRRPILVDLALRPDPAAEAKYDSLERRGDSLVAENYNAYMRSGTGFHLWGIAKPFRDAEGRIIGAIESIRDITHHKETEARLADLAANLEIKVKERTAELEGALAELTHARESLAVAEKHALMGRLGASIAHELNTPLGAILSAVSGTPERILAAIRSLARADDTRCPGCEALADEMVERAVARAMSLEDSSEREAVHGLEAALARGGFEKPRRLARELAELFEPDDALAFAARLAGIPAASSLVESVSEVAALVRSSRIVSEAALKASRVVTAIQSYSRASPGESEPVDPVASIENLLVLYYGAYKRTIRVERSWECRDKVLGSKDRLDQVWVNLVNNALQAMGNQGVLSFSTRRDGSWVEVSVGDDGPGIPAEIQGRIFEPFFTTKRDGEGTGLGLDVCRRFVEGSGGAIRFESRPGRTVFTVRLRVAEAPPEAGPVVQDLPAPSG